MLKTRSQCPAFRIDRQGWNMSENETIQADTCPPRYTPVHPSTLYTLVHPGTSPRYSGTFQYGQLGLGRRLCTYHLCVYVHVVLSSSDMYMIHTSELYTHSLSLMVLESNCSIAPECQESARMSTQGTAPHIHTCNMICTCRRNTSAFTIQ